MILHTDQAAFPYMGMGWYYPVLVSSGMTDFYQTQADSALARSTTGEVTPNQELKLGGCQAAQIGETDFNFFKPFLQLIKSKVQTKEVSWWSQIFSPRAIKDLRQWGKLQAIKWGDFQPRAEIRRMSSSSNYWRNRLQLFHTFPAAH